MRPMRWRQARKRPRMPPAAELSAFGRRLRPGGGEAAPLTCVASGSTAATRRGSGMPDSSVVGRAPTGVCPSGGGAGVQSASSAPGKVVGASSGGVWPIFTARLGWVPWRASLPTLRGWLGWVSPNSPWPSPSSEAARRRKRSLASSADLRLLRGERPNPSVMLGRSFRAGGDQCRPTAFHHRLPLLVFYVQDNINRAAANARDGLGLLDLRLHVDGVADINGLDEFPLVHFAESHHRTFHEAGLHQQAGGDGEAEQTVSYASAERRVLAVFGIDMDLVEISREAGEQGKKRFGNRAASADDRQAGPDFFEIHAALGAG